MGLEIGAIGGSTVNAPRGGLWGIGSWSTVDGAPGCGYGRYRWLLA